MKYFLYVLVPALLVLLSRFIGYYAIAVGLAAYVALILVNKHLGHKSWKDYGFTPVKDYRLVLSAAAISLVPALLVRITVPSFDAWYLPQISLFSLAALPFTVILLAQVFSEELFSRSLLQSGLSKDYGKNSVILTVALVLTTIHLAWFLSAPLEFFLAILISVFAYAIVSSWLFSVTKSIGGTILFHLIINGFGIAQMVLRFRLPVMENWLWLMLLLAVAWTLPSIKPLKLKLAMPQKSWVLVLWTLFICIGMAVASSLI